MANIGRVHGIRFARIDNILLWFWIAFYPTRLGFEKIVYTRTIGGGFAKRVRGVRIPTPCGFLKIPPPTKKKFKICHLRLLNRNRSDMPRNGRGKMRRNVKIIRLDELGSCARFVNQIHTKRLWLHRSITSYCTTFHVRFIWCLRTVRCCFIWRLV